MTVLDTCTGSVVGMSGSGHSYGRDLAAIAVDAPTGRVFVTNSSQNSVSVLDAWTGRLLRLVAVGRTPSALVVDAPTAHVFVLNAIDDTISMLNAHNGTVLRTLHFTAQLGAMAVDAQPGLLLVTTYGWLNEAGTPESRCHGDHAGQCQRARYHGLALTRLACARPLCTTWSRTKP